MIKAVHAPLIDVFSCVGTAKEQLISAYLEVRQIEIIAAGLAAERSSESDIDTLIKIQSEMEKGTGDPVIHRATDLEFHLQICKMTGNPYFFQVCRILYESLEKALSAIVLIMGSQKALYYHARLIDTITNQYAHEARAVMREHLDTTVAAVNAIPDGADVFYKSARNS